MTDVIVVQKSDNTVSVIYTATSQLSMDQIIARRFKNSNEQYQIMSLDDLPTHREFFNAWTYGSTITINMDKAKKIAHDVRRQCRNEEFKPYDDIIAKQIPGEDADDAEAQRALIRTKYATKQTEIDDCTTVDELQAIIDEMRGDV